MPLQGNQVTLKAYIMPIVSMLVSIPEVVNFFLSGYILVYHLHHITVQMWQRETAAATKLKTHQIGMVTCEGLCALIMNFNWTALVPSPFTAPSFAYVSA